LIFRIIELRNHGFNRFSSFFNHRNQIQLYFPNKYHQEYKIHHNKAKALQRVTTKVGMATLMTNLTTAIGFATFVASTINYY
jgi:hypothetical protein